MKIIKGFENYSADERGDIYSHKKTKVIKLKQWVSHDGYKLIQLCKNGVVHSKSVHRLIAETLIPNPYGLPAVNHKDGDKNNNCVDNLEWCTHKQNVQHSFDNGLKNSTGRKMKAVIQLTLDGKEICRYKSARQAEIATGVGRNVIIAVCKNKKYRKSGGGFLWNYEISK
jgi:hypothetical protein